MHTMELYHKITTCLQDLDLQVVGPCKVRRWFKKRPEWSNSTSTPLYSHSSTAWTYSYI